MGEEKQLFNIFLTLFIPFRLTFGPCAILFGCPPSELSVYMESPRFIHR
jgi:hypothetical protein